MSTINFPSPPSPEQLSSQFRAALKNEQSETVHAMLHVQELPISDVLLAWQCGHEEAVEKLHDWVRQHPVSALEKISRLGERALAEEVMDEIALQSIRQGNYDLLQATLDAGLQSTEMCNARIAALRALALCDNHAIDMLKPDDDTREVARRIVLAQIAAYDLPVNMEGFDRSLLGCEPQIMCQAIAQALRNLGGDEAGKRHLDTLMRMFERATERRNGKDLLQELNEYGHCLIPCGWEDHALAILFYRDPNNQLFCAICNPGMRPCHQERVIAFEVDHTRLDEDILDKICKFKGSREQGFSFYYGELMQELKKNNTAFTQNVASTAPGEQKAENCAYNSMKCALRTMLAFLELSGQPSAQYRSTSKRVRWMAKNFAYLILLDNLTTYKRDSNRHPELVEFAEGKAQKKCDALHKPTRAQVVPCAPQIKRKSAEENASAVPKRQKSTDDVVSQKML